MDIESPVRKRIIDTATNLFYEQGYNSTGINQVIADADIARASLYNHFSSKTELLYACVEQKDKDWFKELEVYLSKITDPKKRIIGIFDFRIERQIKENFGGCPFVKVSAEISAEERKTFGLINTHKEHLKVYIKELVMQIKPSQELLDVDMLAETLFLLMEGATMMVNMSKQQKALSSAKKIAQQLLA